MGVREIVGTRARARCGWRRCDRCDRCAAVERFDMVRVRVHPRDGRQYDADLIRKAEQGETLRPGLSAEGLTTCIVRVLLEIRRARRRG
jgi:hypothetical protein